MKIIAIILFAILAARAASAEVSLSNAEASRLFVALRSAQPGLSATNTRNAALNINSLRPIIEAYDAGQQVVQRKAISLAKDPDRDTKGAALNDEAMALARQSIKVNLVTFAVSDDEIKDAKITPDSLAEFIRFLTPDTPPKKK